MPISLTQFFQLYNFQFLQYLSLLIGKKIEREESHAKPERQIFPMRPHIYRVGFGFWQSWACMSLIKVPINSGHLHLTKTEAVREDRIWLLVMLKPCAAFQKPLAGAEQWTGVRTENQPQEPAPLSLENFIFLNFPFLWFALCLSNISHFQPHRIWQPPV